MGASVGTNIAAPTDSGENAKTERLEARITGQQKKLLQRAASLQGRTVSEFVVSSAQAAAIRAIEEHEIIRLSERDRQTFVSALLNPPAPNAKLRAAAQRYKKTFGL